MAILTTIAATIGGKVGKKVVKKATQTIVKKTAKTTTSKVITKGKGVYTKASQTIGKVKSAPTRALRKAADKLTPQKLKDLLKSKKEFISKLKKQNKLLSQAKENIEKVKEGRNAESKDENNVVRQVYAGSEVVAKVLYSETTQMMAIYFYKNKTTRASTPNGMPPIVVFEVDETELDNFLSAQGQPRGMMGYYNDNYSLAYGKKFNTDLASAIDMMQEIKGKEQDLKDTEDEFEANLEYFKGGQAIEQPVQPK